MFDVKSIAVGAALGALTTKAMGDGYAKGAAAGAVVASSKVRSRTHSCSYSRP